MSVSLTFDIDWAAEFVLQDLIELLEAFKVKSTFFVTHHSPLIDKLDRNYFEIALHPNFNPLLNGEINDYREPIDKLLEIYPEAKGVRSHCLFQSSHILVHGRERNLIYDGNMMLPLQKGIYPYFHRSLNILRIPFFWADDTHLYSSQEFTLDQIPVLGNEFNTIAFHPIHIYLNTEKLERYNNARPFLKDYDQLQKFRNVETGTRTLFISLLEEIKAKQIVTYKQIEIAEIYYERDSKK